ncbi:MAG: LuxR family transcriptional regulator [Actinomycetia bacterium]|nr:LuxR family transcriptional regulator [Actinomycetes bacterium]
MPADLTSFVGRGYELSQVRQLLSQSRLVTLTGFGGVGKSRLALRVAQQLSRVFPDGVWLVELSSLQDGALLPQAVSQALGIADLASGDPVETLSRALARRNLLVVVDNCEHLVPSCQYVLTMLLKSAPDLRVLATSREVLRIPGEQVCQVAPLEVPEPGGQASVEALGRYPGVALFARRAGEVRPVFAVTTSNADAVARVCGFSEGMPLFLELAAAQLRWLSVEQLAGRMADRFHLLTGRPPAVVARHQSLRAAVEWSFTLCSEAERLVWIRASAFAGRFDLGAAEAVCAGDGLSASEVLDALAGLIDKSVLVAAERDGDLRYWMLDTLRLYGQDQLEAMNGTAAPDLRRRHRDYYLGLAGRFTADWFGPRQAGWSRRMRADLPELRAALSYSLSTPGEETAAIRLAGRLNYLWLGCGAAREGSLWLERVLAALPSPGGDRARVLAAQTRVLTLRSLHAEAAGPARECLELARHLGDPGLLGEAVTCRGMNLMYTGDMAAAVPLLDEGIERAAARPDIPIAVASATMCRGLAATTAGDAALADALFGRCQAVCRAAGDTSFLSLVLAVSIPAVLALGELARATAYGHESLAGSAALGDTLVMTAALEALAWVASAGGDHRRAARLLGAANRQAWVHGGSPFHAEGAIPAHGQCEAAARAALGETAFGAEFRTGSDLSLDEAIGYAQQDGPARPAEQAPAAAPPEDGPAQLTRRELEIAELVAVGLTNQQIANQLVISRRTAEGHVEHILGKLGFTTRTQIAAWLLARNETSGPPA